jgi:hypothetical protein
MQRAERERGGAGADPVKPAGQRESLDLALRQIARQSERRQRDDPGNLDEPFQRVAGIGFGKRGERGQPLRPLASTPRRPRVQHPSAGQGMACGMIADDHPVAP